MTSWQPHGHLAPHEKLYFLHIPKTAGTALRTFLESHFDRDRVCPHLTMPEILPVPPSELLGYDLFCGHHARYVNQILAMTPVTVTVLRDPLKRAVSHFRHLQATEEAWLHELVKGKSFEDFVCSDMGVAELLNFQTRFLVFDDIQRDHFGHSELRIKDPEGLVRKYSDPGLLDRARRVLDEIAFVGIQERFNDTLRLLSCTLGWAPVREFPAFNRAKVGFEESAMTDRARDRVLELSEIDRAVYEHGRGLFESRLAGLTPEFEEEQYRRAMRARPRLSEVRYGFDRAVNGENWLPIERPGGRYARWTGPGTSTTLDLPLATDRALRVRFYVGSQTMDVIESLRVFANDRELEVDWWQMHDPAKAQRTCEVTLDPAVLRLNDAYCRLRFDVARVVTPAEEWPGRTDKRRLALYFFWLEVDPA